MYQFIDSIQVKDNGVPILSHKKIETIIDGCFAEFDPTLTQKPQRVCISSFIDLLKKKDGLKYEVRSLGLVFNNIILGMMDTDKGVLSIDPVTQTNPHVLRFTEAHEVGHWVLHRHYEVSGYSAGSQQKLFKDTEETISSQKRLTTATDWIEWQANAFASSFLMPMKTFSQSVSNGISLLELSVTKDAYGSIQTTPKDYNRLVTYLSELYDVSMTAISLRMKQLENIRPVL